MVEIQNINPIEKSVTSTDGKKITHKEFLDSFRDFLTNRIAGHTIIPSDMERFTRRTSGKNLSMLMKGKKMEGYMEGVMDKLLTRGQKIALGTILAIIIVLMVVVVVLKNMGILNF